MQVWGGYAERQGGKSLAEYARARGTKIGEGTGGSVYHVQLDGKAGTHAMKVISIIDEEDGQRNFLPSSPLQEVAALRALKGAPNVIQLDKVRYDEENIYLFLSFKEGTLLNLMSSEGFRPMRSMRGHFSQLLAGLHAIHSQGIIHNDIKPQNILADRENNLFYTDFGLSLAVRCDGNFPAVGATTERFSAPEELVLNEASKNTDVFSLAMTMACYLGICLPRENSLQMLARVNGRSVETIVEHIREKAYQGLKDITLSDILRISAVASTRRYILENVPDDIIRDIDAMLVTDPKRRTSVDQFRSIEFVRGYTRVPGPLARDPLRCEHSSTSNLIRARGIAFANEVNRLAKALSVISREFEVEISGLSLALAVDLARRLSQTCETNANLGEYFMLCLFISEKLHFSRVFDVSIYHKFIPKRRGFSPIDEERDILARVDFDILSCQTAQFYSTFEGKTIRQAQNLIFYSRR